jgi:hypothetical protein
MREKPRGRNTGDFIRDLHDPDDIIEGKLKKYIQDFDLILDAPVFAEGAKQSRLEALKSKLDKLTQEVREEQRIIREKINESLDFISLNELADLLEPDESEASLQMIGADKLEPLNLSEARETKLLNIQKNIVALRKKIQFALTKLVD